MIRIFGWMLAMYMTACGPGVTDITEEKALSGQKHVPGIAEAKAQTAYEETAISTEADYATCFIVVADTNIDYYSLHEKMTELSLLFNSSIDTLGRFYDETKNLIILPEDDEDEMYAGAYYPRRFPSESLSLEYLRFYKKDARAETIALVTGIYENERSADSALAVLSRVERNVFKVQARLYAGCIH